MLKHPALLAGLALLITFAANAGEQPRHIPLIGVVRIEQVFKDYSYAKDREAAIKSEFEAAEKEIADLDQQMKEKGEKLVNDPMIKRGSAAWKLEMLEIEKLKVQREAKMLEFKQDVAKRMAEFYRDVYARFRQAVGIYANYHKYDLIITAPNAELSDEGEKMDSPQAIQNEILARRVQFIGATTDVTNPIIQLMNQRYEKEKTAGGTN